EVCCTTKTKREQSALHPTRTSGAATKYRMSLPPFASWIQRRQIHIPESDKLLPLIAQAGAVGITRAEIGKAITLERDVLDSFLNGLVQVGVLTVSVENGIRKFRATAI